MAEIDSLTPLQHEQRPVQDGKFRYRELRDYNTMLFKRPRPPIAEFLGGKAAGATTIVELLQGLPSAAESEDGAVHWADMAGGLAVAQRQAAAMQQAGELGKTVLTNVDLFDWADTMSPPELQSIAWSAKIGLRDEDPAPELIIGDAGRTELPRPADLLTSIQAIQYFDDPLGALAHWYNQLRDNGLMVVGRERELWSSKITAEDGEPFADLFKQFEKQGVSFAADTRRVMDSTGEYYEGFGALAIQKLPGTSIQPKAAPVSQEVTTRGYKSVRYDDARPAMELVAA